MIIIIQIGDCLNDEKRDLVITKHKIIKDKNGRNKNYYQYYCNKCGWDCNNFYKNGKYEKEYWIIECNLLKGNGCLCCSNQIVNENNSIFTTDKWMISIIGEENAKKYTHGSAKNILCICPDCGTKKEMVINNLHNRGFSCPKCSDGISYPNKFMFNLLKQLGIEFETEYNPDWIKPKRYDFYIPSMNLIVEMDGGFHNKYNSLSGQTEKETKEIDNYKDKLANEHGLKVIRIDCDYEDISTRYNYIKENTILKLNELFNLSNIDWVKLNIQSNSNLIKIASNYKKNNSKITTSQISKKMGGFSKETISRWLKIGTELGWCNYNPKEEQKYSGEVSAYSKYKPIICVNNNLTFKSIKECAEKSEDIFGIKLLESCISSVCKGKSKNTRGFIFRYL